MVKHGIKLNPNQNEKDISFTINSTIYSNQF